MRASNKSIKYIACVLAALLCFAAAGCNVRDGRDRTPDIQPHLISTPESAPVRPIDAREAIAMPNFDGELSTEQNFRRLEELYNIVVYEGAKPTFAENDPTEKVYRGATEVLDKIILNSWHDSANGELNIIHSIHDYLVCNIEYDFELYEQYKAADDSGRAEYKYNSAFDLSGVFVNRRAVCDGLSRAVVFLCAIEGVESVRITGTYGNIPHAWNKVKLDGSWYNMDVTADMVNYNFGGGEYYKQLSHGYFLVSDATMQAFKPTPHGAFVAETYEIYPAKKDYAYFENKYVTVGDNEYKRIIKNQDELNAVFADINKNRRTIGKIELKLDFDNKTDVNAVDAYKTEIAEAYKKIKLSNFNLSQDSLPYFRYPNGVYVFLMYK